MSKENPNKDILRYLKLHDQKLINFKSLITEKYDLNKINVAISKMKNGESAGRIIIELWQKLLINWKILQIYMDAL